MPSPIRSRVLDGVRRLSALVCLGSAYQYAVTSFNPAWLAVTLISALVVATGPLHWAVAPDVPPRALSWPSWRSLRRNLIPGWMLMTTAAGCKLLHASPRVVLWIWVAGAIWVVAGTAALSRQQPGELGAPSGAGRWTWACGALVVGFAAALRLWSIDTVPRYVHCDEGTMVLIGESFFADPNRDWLGPPPAGGYALHMNPFYALGSLGTRLLGFNLTGARLPDALLGICSIALMFAALNRVSNLKVATVASLLLAANHCHLAFSRIAFGFIQTAVVVALAFATFARVWVAPTYLNAAILGMVLAAGAFSYHAAVLMVPLLATVLVLLGLLHPERRRALRVPVAVCAITFMTAVAPYGVVLWQEGPTIFVRIGELNIFSAHKMRQLKEEVYHTDSAAAVVAHQAWNSLRGFHVGADHQPQYGSDKPMADPYTAALMVPGALLSLLGFRQFVATNALVVTVGYLLYGLGMAWAPGFDRTTGALPLGMVLPAIALVQCWGALWAGRARWLGWVRTVCLSASVALCVAANLHIYFVDYGYSVARGDEPSETGWAARKYVSQYTVHLVNWPLPGYEGLRLIIGGLPITLRPNEPTVDYVRHAEVSGSDLFIISGEDPPARDALLARFPDARLETWTPDATHGPKLFLVFVGEPRTTTRGQAPAGDAVN